MMLLAALVLHGIVLGIDPKASQATVHHEAFGGMPSMTMTFSIDPGSIARMRVGDRITAAVDESSEPWKLRILSESSAPPADTGRQDFVPLLQPGSSVPDATFVDQSGRTLSWQNFRGHTTVVSFIYTRCRDAHMCPLVSAKFGEMQSMIPSNARLIEFTLDPTYDTPSVLAHYGAAFGAKNPPWRLATGDDATMRRLAMSFGVGVSSRVAGTIVHSEAVAIVNRDGTVRVIVNGNDWSPQEVVAEVRDAEGLGSSPWDRFMLAGRSAINAAARACGALDSGGHLRPLILFLEGVLFVVLAFALIELVRWLRRRRT
jgi:protein SCO1